MEAAVKLPLESEVHHHSLPCNQICSRHCIVSRRMYQRETPDDVFNGRTFTLAAARLPTCFVEGMRDPIVGRDTPLVPAMCALNGVGLPPLVAAAKRSTAATAPLMCN